MRSFNIIYNSRKDKWFAIYQSPFTDDVRTRLLGNSFPTYINLDELKGMGYELVNLDYTYTISGLGDFSNFSYYSKSSYLNLYTQIFSSSDNILKSLYRLIFSESIYYIQSKDEVSVMQDFDGIKSDSKSISFITSEGVSDFIGDLLHIDIGDTYDKSSCTDSNYTIVHTDTDKFTVNTLYYSLDTIKDSIKSNLTYVISYYKSLGFGCCNADLKIIKNILLEGSQINLTNCFVDFEENDSVITNITIVIHKMLCSIISEFGVSILDKNIDYIFSSSVFKDFKDLEVYNITKITQMIMNCVNRVKQTYLRIALKALLLLPFDVSILMNTGIPIIVNSISDLNKVKLYRVIDFNITINCSYKTLIGYDTFNEFMSVLYSKYTPMSGLTQRVYFIGGISYLLESVNKFKLYMLGEFSGKPMEIIDYPRLKLLRSSTEIHYLTDISHIEDLALITYMRFLFRNGLFNRLVVIFIDTNNSSTSQLNSIIETKLVSIRTQLCKYLESEHIQLNSIKIKILNINTGNIINYKNTLTKNLNKLNVFTVDDFKSSNHPVLDLTSLRIDKTVLSEYLSNSLSIYKQHIKFIIQGLDKFMLELLLKNMILDKFSCSIKYSSFNIISPVYLLSNNIKCVVLKLLISKVDSKLVNTSVIQDFMLDFSTRIDIALYNYFTSDFDRLVESYYKVCSDRLEDYIDNNLTLTKILEVVYTILYEV